jgi:AsmA-like C-terminal region
MKSKILKITGLVLLAIASVIFATPWLLKGKIIHLVKANINRNLRAHVNFTDVDISLFRHFPKISIGLDNVQATCVGEFQDDTLFYASQLDMVCDIRSLISGDSIRLYSLTLNEPRIHAVTHKNGHSNWNILETDAGTNGYIDSSYRPFSLRLQRYVIHKGYIDYTDEKRDMHIVAVNLEQEGRGDFSADLFTLNTRTTADAIHLDFNGAVPYRVVAKTSIDLSFRVDNKTHTYTFNTDQVSFNDLKLHTEGFFQWINDSSYSMNIKFKVPSTKFKNILSMLPSVYQKNFTSIEANGQVNFNGFIRGKYDEKHFPAYHTNLYVVNGYFKYPDLPVPVEHIGLALQIDNPDGIADHKTINLSEGHVEINHDTVDMHLFVKNLQTKPFIDFAFVGKLDLANVSKLIKLEPETRLSGTIHADIHAAGNFSESEKHKKEQFQSSGQFDLSSFLYASKNDTGGIALHHVLMTFNSKNVLIHEMNGEWLSTHMDVTGAVDNLFDFALRNRPLRATVDLKADEFNLRDWLNANKNNPDASSARASTAFVVPGNMNLTINAAAGKFHFDNLDLQNLSGKLIISDETVQLIQVKANGLDGDVTLNGTYSTLENRENPEFGLVYDAKGLDIQKTFLAFNTIRKIMPIGKFIAGNVNAHMSLNGCLNEDMTTDLRSLNGEGEVTLVTGLMKDFGPMDKLSQSLDIEELKDIPLKDVKAEFSFRNGRVDVSPFAIHTKDIDLAAGGTHGFDQSLNYDVSLKVPRDQLGSKGSLFVKNVVTQAAEKGIPVKLNDAVNMNVKMGGTINSPDVKPDMDAVVDNAATDLKKEVNDFVNAKLDSAKQQLRNPPAATKKALFVQTTYKSKAGVKSKKTSGSVHKNAAHKPSKKKHKKPAKNYSVSLKKEKRTASR